MRKTTTKTYFSSSSNSATCTTEVTRTTIVSGSQRQTKGTIQGCSFSKCCRTDEGEPSKSQTHSKAPTLQLEQRRPSSGRQPASVASTFEQECLAQHNRQRESHGCPPLQLDKTMCKFAKEWAQNIANKNIMQHRPNNKFGENIYWASGKEVTGKDVVEAWYGEIKHYNFNTSRFSSSTGHFTQVVWKSSKKLGIGFVKSGNSIWVVANYDPPGNVSGQYKENVPRKIR